MANKQTNENWLRKHYKGEFLIYFRSFIEGYFVQGYDYSDLPMISKEYKSRAASYSKEGLLRELLLIKEKDDWDYIQEFVSKHGMRKLSHEKLKAMVELLLNELSASKHE